MNLIGFLICESSTVSWRSFTSIYLSNYLCIHGTLIFLTVNKKAYKQVQTKMSKFWMSWTSYYTKSQFCAKSQNKVFPFYSFINISGRSIWL